MLTRSSKPTMAKKASVVAAMTDQNMPRSPAGSKVRTRETSPCRPDRPEADHDDDQEARELDAGEHHVRFHALADATEIHDGDECHEEKADERNAGSFKPKAEAVREVGRKGP